MSFNPTFGSINNFLLVKCHKMRHTAWCKKISPCLKFPPHFCQAKWPAHAQPIGPDGTCVTKLSSINFARPCRERLDKEKGCRDPKKEEARPCSTLPSLRLINPVSNQSERPRHEGDSLDPPPLAPCVETSIKHGDTGKFSHNFHSF